MSILNTLNEISDLDDCIKKNLIHVCMLRPGTKISYGGWKKYASYNDIYNLEYAENNLGISLPGIEYSGEKILTCIDIDGDKEENRPENFLQISKDWFFKILSNKLDEKSINYMACRSSSGGYHIYLYALQEEAPHIALANMQYPQTTSDLCYDEEMEMFLSAHRNELLEILGESIPKTAVEFWCKKRYIVAPGSEIYDDGKLVGVTTLLPNGVHRFQDIDTCDISINTLIREAFIDAGFIEQQKSIQFNPQAGDVALSSQLQTENIELIGDFLLKYLPKLHGQKHTFCLALGGFFFRKKLSIESIEAIGQYVIDKTPPNFFKNDKLFIETLTHDTREKDEQRITTGLNTVEEMLEPFANKRKVGKQLHLLTNPVYHKFWPDGTISKEYDEVHMDFAQKYMSISQLQTSFQKDGEISITNKSSTRVLQCIDGFEYIDDISEREPNSPWEKSIQLFFSTEDNSYSYVYKDVEEMIQKYRSLPGCHSNQSRKIIERVFREFDTLNLIKNKEGATRAGIWFSRETNKLRKFVNESGKIVEKKPYLPTKFQLRDSINLLHDIYEAYPWKDDKFGVIVKMGLTMPYAYVMAEQYNKFHPSLILHGEAGTLKTSGGELITYFNGDFSKNEEDYITGGGELETAFRFGRIMDKSSYPLIVNEAEHLFANGTIRELIKDSSAGKKIREPGGNFPRVYYSCRPSFYTMNNLPEVAQDPAFLRRFITLEFTQDERGDKREVVDALSFLNTNGIINYRFRELSVIGDYVFWLLNQNMDWFMLELGDIQDNIVAAIEQYTEYKLDFLHNDIQDSLYLDRSDQEDSMLTMILNQLRFPYQNNKGFLLNNGGNESERIRALITNSPHYNYVDFTAKGDILINAEFTRQFNQYHARDRKSLSLKNLAAYLTNLDLGLGTIEYTKTRVKGRKNQVRGVKVQFMDFCKIVTNNANVI